jgi:hypothetical protein
MTDPDASRIEADLAHAAQVRREHADLQTRLTGAGGYLESAEQRVNELRQKLADEAGDVAKLESFSPTRIMATLKGSRVEDLDRENAEHDAARYAVAEAEARRDAAHRDVESLRSQLAALGDVEALHAGALAAKEEWASTHDPVTAAALSEIGQERGELAARDKEAREAHEAGREALGLLDQAGQLLGSAESWSTWDTFGGGGMLSDMAKYNKMDQATEVLHRADVALGRFSRELADLGMGAVGGAQVDTMIRTFDMFFDNIFTDMAVRSRIQDAGRRAAAAGQAVRRSLARLEETGREITRQLADLEARREEVLSA